jgi:hypothetical protein
MQALSKCRKSWAKALALTEKSKSGCKFYGILLSTMPTKHAIQELVKDATVQADKQPGQFIGQQVADIFNAILGDANKQAETEPGLKDNPVLKSINPATHETRWAELKVMASQLDKMPIG